MTEATGPSARVTALIEKLEWLSRTGARSLRGVAIVGAAAAVACWALIARGWDGFGLLLLVLALVPTATLWVYARSLDAAVDATKLQLSVGALGSKAAERVGEVRATLQSGRLRWMRAAWRVVTSVRELRDDVNQFGIDLAAWIAVGSPIMLSAVALSLGAVLGLLALALLAALVALIF